MVFMGTYTPKLDDKGRLFLPAKFRDRLSEGLVVTQRAGELPRRLAVTTCSWRRRTRGRAQGHDHGQAAATTSGCSFAERRRGPARQAGPDGDPGAAAGVRRALRVTWW